jgi:hypothetical protein
VVLAAGPGKPVSPSARAMARFTFRPKGLPAQRGKSAAHPCPAGVLACFDYRIAREQSAAVSPPLVSNGPLVRSCHTGTVNERTWPAVLPPFRWRSNNSACRRCHALAEVTFAPALFPSHPICFSPPGTSNNAFGGAPMTTLRVSTVSTSAPFRFSVTVRSRMPVWG